MSAKYETISLVCNHKATKKDLVIIYPGRRHVYKCQICQSLKEKK